MKKLLAAEFAENVEQGLCFSATLAALFANFVVKCLLLLGIMQMPA
jgi:hypothetical protein